MKPSMYRNGIEHWLDVIEAQAKVKQAFPEVQHLQESSREAIREAKKNILDEFDRLRKQDAT